MAHPTISSLQRAQRNAHRRRVVATLLAVLGLSLLVGYCVIQSNEEKAVDQASQAKEAADHAISVLPPGVEDAWNAWIDNQVATKIVREGNVLRLHEFLEMGPIYVSTNTPYKVDCSLGINVVFGSSNSENTGDAISIDSPPASPQMSKLLKPGEIPGLSADKNAPPLGVPPNSIAAEQLKDRLCRRVAAAVAKVMQ